MVVARKFICRLTGRDECDINICHIEKQPPEVFCKQGVLKNFTKFT